MSVVIALGGNALLPKGSHGVVSELSSASRALKSISSLLKSPCVLTHGNGPQVGNILLRDSAKVKKSYSVPLSVAVAESQGEIGFVIEQALGSITKKPLATLLTRVLVDPGDDAFSFPSKPIGPFYSQKQALRLPFPVKRDSNRGWRRVVPSPRPVRILEASVIRKLLSAGVLAIAAGGGGIPVVKKGRSYAGVDAVIDKDFASSVLARDISASRLYLLTSVPFVYLNYGTRNQSPIKKLSASEAVDLAQKGEFAEGSMLPKVQAAVQFVTSGRSRRAIISDLSAKKGTVILK